MRQPVLPFIRTGSGLGTLNLGDWIKLRVNGLPGGQYEFRVDGERISTGREQNFAGGIAARPRDASAQKLRQAIHEKNELFFRRYRPQNETYLFLFRKHEQGNNAVEIPQFDPLIAAKEAEIAKLRQPSRQRFELIKMNP
jgi:hypothetical protein